MSRLKATLHANALSCGVFGSLFVLAPVSVAGFLGVPPAPSPVVGVLGAALLLHAAHLLYVGRRANPGRWAVTYFAAGDGVWVAATLALILTGTWITTPAGIAAALALALVVGMFGVVQWRELGRRAAGGSDPAPELGRGR